MLSDFLLKYRLQKGIIMSVFKRLDFWLIVGFVLVFFLILPFVPISDGDTFYYISKARRILNTGDLFNLNTLTTKPVLGMWAMALSLKIWGYNLSRKHRNLRKTHDGWRGKNQHRRGGKDSRGN